MADIKDKLKEITDKLEQGIKELFESERYKTYLTVMSRFHSYSYRNSLLILMQKPDATYIAGFNAWKNHFKRHVNKGEKGIQILAPAPYKVKVKMQKLDPETQKPILDNNGNPVIEEVEVVKPFFKPVYVFDISQTSGEPLPELVTELKGNVEHYDAFLESLKKISPFPIEFEDIKGTAKGYCDPVNKKIVIKKGMSEIQTIKTAIHEITHADLHSEPHLLLEEKKDRKTKEVEAESVAFAVCSHFGIDTSDYSFAYVASWSSTKELQELKNSLDTIQKQAAELINKIDSNFKELLKDVHKAELNKRQEEILDSIKFDNEIDLDKEKSRESLGFRDYDYQNESRGNPDYYKFFYAGEQDKEAKDFQQQTGWNIIWGADSQSLNGDTWIVYRNLTDLPKWLQEYAKQQEKYDKKCTIRTGKDTKISERIEAAKVKALAQNKISTEKTQCKKIEKGER